ncbi:MAG: GxxExxY protein [Methylococcaceae bacterium]
MALLYEDETYKIIGACINVHKALGPGFLESVYQEALEKELIRLKIPYIRHKKLQIVFNGEFLNKFFVADLVCFDVIIVELKASQYLSKIDLDQTINYLKSTNLCVGLLVNFGESSLRWKRFINSRNITEASSA